MTCSRVSSHLLLLVLLLLWDVPGSFMEFILKIYVSYKPINYKSNSKIRMSLTKDLSA